ncbi:MAG: hypothetical protein AVDCRST_MAG72-1065, partial [uncultured Nocardioidaceae bacterium]
DDQAARVDRVFDHEQPPAADPGDDGDADRGSGADRQDRGRGGPGRAHHPDRPAHRRVAQRPAGPQARHPGRTAGQANRDGLGRPRDGHLRDRSRHTPRDPALGRQRHLRRHRPPRRGRERVELQPGVQADVAVVAAVRSLVRPAAGLPFLRRTRRRDARDAPDLGDDDLRGTARGRHPLPQHAAGPGAGQRDRGAPPAAADSAAHGGTAAAPGLLGLDGAGSSRCRGHRPHRGRRPVV